MKIERTKSGKPALWEQGGGLTSRGNAQIICGPEGERLIPYYVRRGGHLACGQHALMPIRIGGYIICASQSRGDYSISVNCITFISSTDDTADAEEVYRFSENEWNVVPPEFLNDAVIAARRKAGSYHCRSIYYALEQPKAVV